jgi:hypothetical protein
MPEAAEIKLPMQLCALLEIRRAVPNWVGGMRI